MTLSAKYQSVRHLGAGRFLIAILALVLCGACRPDSRPVKLFGEAQGTYYSIQYYDSRNRDLQHEVDSLLADFDMTASLWVDSSLLRRVNRNETDSVNDIFADMLRQSLYINRYTDGAFDCRIGRVVQAWGFSFRTQEAVDSASLTAMLDAARGEVTIDGYRVVKQNPATELDFNAIAQGYTSDLLARYFDSLGISSYLIDVGGEVVAKGQKADGKPWRVGIERPAEEKSDMPVLQTAIELRDCSVVTSGSYRKYYEKDGVRYSHTIDPTTGAPVGHSLLSVSVVEKSGWLADAMATAYMVMGLERAKAFIETHPDGPGTQSVFFIYDDHGELATYSTPGFQKLIVEQ